MLNCIQYRELIVRPALQTIQIWDPDSEEIIIGTTAIESLGGTYVKQIQGPALGLLGMEPTTHDDIWTRYIPHEYRIGNAIAKYFHLVPGYRPPAEMMIYNIAYAVIMARLKYLMCPGKIPDANDTEDQAQYYKKYYNTALGKSTVEEYIDLYNRFIGKPNLKKGKKS